MILSIIVAASQNNVIGANNQLLWKLPDDMKWFKNITSGHTVIMGRKTYESLGKPLPKRRNIVITRDPNLLIEGCEVVHSLDEALEKTSHEKEVFVIGGGEIYKQAWHLADKLYLTRVKTVVEGDTFIPTVSHWHWTHISAEIYQADEKHPYPYSFNIYLSKKSTKRIVFKCSVTLTNHT